MKGCCRRQCYEWGAGWFLCFWGMLLVPVVNAEPIKCGFSVGNESDMRCNCSEVSDAPWSHNQVNVAPSPESLLLHETKTPTRLEISWTYKGADISHVEKGFYLEIQWDGGPFPGEHYNCDVDVRNLTSLEVPVISFDFEDCCGSQNNEFEVKAGVEVTVKVHARPMYNTGDKPHYARNTTTILGNTTSISGNTTSISGYTPRSGKRRRGKRRRKKGRGKRHRTKSVKDSGPAVDLSQERMKGNRETIGELKIVITVLVTALFFCIAFIIAWCIIQRKKQRNEQRRRVVGRRRILLVGDERDKRYVPLINQVFETLKKYGRGSTEIVCNVRSVTEIANEGVIGWAARNVADVDVVVCVVTNPEQVLLLPSENGDDQAVSHVGVTLQILQSKALKSGFKTAREKFLALDTITCDPLPFCRHYNLRQGMNELLKCALGPHYQYTLGSEHRSALEKCLSNAESAPKDPGAIPKRWDARRDQQKLFNDLDASLSLDTLQRREPSMAPNIVQGGPPSVESNTCK